MWHFGASAKLLSDFQGDAKWEVVVMGNYPSERHRLTNCCCFGFLSDSRSSTVSLPAKAWA